VAVDTAHFAEGYLASYGLDGITPYDHFRDVEGLLPRVKVIKLKNNRVGFAAIDARVFLKVTPNELPSHIYSCLVSFASPRTLFGIPFLVVGAVICPLAFTTVALALA
jgi:hypothetical protein